MNSLSKCNTPRKSIWVCFILAVILLAATPGIIPASVSAAGKTAYVTTEGLNVRSRPNIKGKRITSLPLATKVTILKTKKNKKKETWYQIRARVNSVSYKGYVLSTYIGAKPRAASNVSYSRSGKTKAACTLYKAPRKSSKSKAYLKKGIGLKLKNRQKIGKQTWYFAKTTGLKPNYSGYLQAKYIKFQKTTASSTTYQVAITNANSTVYKTANNSDTRLGVVKTGRDVIVLASFTTGGKKWAKVKSSYGTGYVLAQKLTNVIATVDNTSNYLGKVTKKSCARKVASLLASNNGTADVGTTVTIVGKLTVNKVNWYKCMFTHDTGTVTGYIRASAISLSNESNFQEALNAFPDSYKPYLLELHANHPNWVFHAVPTNLNWSDVISGESGNGKNTIQSNCPKGGTADQTSAPFSYLSTNNGDYDWSTDTYTLRDGSNWYAASDAVISYYMDPRNFLNDTGIFQFEALNYEATQTQDVVNTMLANTFMNGNYSVTDKATGQAVSGSYSDAFMAAASASGVSPYYLVSRVKNEVGSTGSGSTSGTYSRYEGYYNFYNIGANDSASGQAIANGLAWAKTGNTYDRPWTTPYKSIVGGAKYIGSQYIALGQNTMYTQKFNVVIPASLYLHQYMTAVTAANTYAKSNYAAYNGNNLLGNAYSFHIPVYNNMPETPSGLPEASGNPNSFIKTLSVKNVRKAIDLNQTFDYKTTDYTAAVASSVANITISASPVSKYAKIAGTGTYALASGNNTIKLVCTAGNGTTTTYTITITRR